MYGFGLGININDFDGKGLTQNFQLTVNAVGGVSGGQVMAGVSCQF